MKTILGHMKKSLALFLCGIALIAVAVSLFAVYVSYAQEYREITYSSSRGEYRILSTDEATQANDISQLLALLAKIVMGSGAVGMALAAWGFVGAYRATTQQEAPIELTQHVKSLIRGSGRCPQCGARYPAGAQYCLRCGNQLR